MKKNKNIILTILLILTTTIFLYLIVNIINNKEFYIDSWWYSSFLGQIRNSHLDWLMKAFTFLGSTTFYIVSILAVLLILKNKKIGLVMGLNVGGSALIMKIIKALIKRPRPVGYMLISETGYSFPSGHSLNAVVFYGLIMYFTYKYIKNKKLRNILLILEIFLVLLIGFSRLYLGVHYPTDVVGGYLFGFIYFICFSKLVIKKILIN